jgi:hypothetical protein
VDVVGGEAAMVHECPGIGRHVLDACITKALRVPKAGCLVSRQAVRRSLNVTSGQGETSQQAAAASCCSKQV